MTTNTSWRTRSATILGGALLSFAVTVAVAAAAPGDLDPSFGDHGIVSTAIGPGASFDGIGDVEIQADGKLLMPGEAGFGGTAESTGVLVRYERHGVLDSTFGSGGIVTTAITPGADRNVFVDVEIQPDGKLVTAGQTNSGPGAGGRNAALVRYQADGSLDTSFGSGGIVVTALSPGDAPEAIVDIAIQPDGKIVGVGQSNEPPPVVNRHLALARYNPDGSLDGSFGSGGIVIMDVAPGSGLDFFPALAIQDDGKIVVGGQAVMGTGAGGANFALVRFNTDGSLDSTFGSGGIVTVAVAPGDNSELINDLKLLPDGRIAVGGRANMGSTGGGHNFAVARFNPGGSLDTSFGTGGVAVTAVGPGADVVQSLALDSAGRIVAGGWSGPGAAFDPDSSVYAVARYEANGNLDASFGSGGIVTTAIGGDTGYDAIFGVAIDKNGKIVAAGECDTGAGTGLDFCAARYKAADESG